jgi:membrane-bound lytic murein transglycosylase D
MMKKIFSIALTLSVLLLRATAGGLLMPAQQQTDTAIVVDPRQKEIIDEVVKTKTPPPKEKVQYFSQVTKYGFKNLFAQYSYNPTLPYSSQVNPHAESYMQDYLKVHSNGLIKMKGWGQPYFNLMDNILSQYGLPRELKYLAVIESHLNSGATSWVGAGGPWQFMPYTARDYGLVVNQGYDERRDYYKSTHAAARYLLTLYGQMHDWLLVIAAYNGGPGRVFSAIKKSGSRNFWSLQYYLPTESRNHVKKFIATHYIMEGFGGVTTTPNLNGDMGIRAVNSYDKKPDLSETEFETAATQSISGKYNSAVITKNLSMDIILFNRYNPDFDNMMAINGNYDLRLPADKMQLFLANKYVILNECVQLLLGDNPTPVNHTTYPKQKSQKKKNG